MSITYHFDLYPRDDPRDGTRLVRFTKLQSAEYRGEANGTGSGRFSLRGDTTDAGFIDPAGLQYVRVVRDDGATELVVGGFFLDNGDFTALDERETRLLTFGGAGTLSYLARAMMWSHSYLEQHPDVFVADDPFDDMWRLYSQGPAAGGDLLGAVLWRAVWEGQHYESPAVADDDRTVSAIPDVVLDFDGFDDSNGADWTLTSGEFKAQIGESVLSVVKRLMEAGLYVSMDPDTFVLSAYQAASHGRDRTGSSWGTNVIRFQAPTSGDLATGNIKSDAKRAIVAFIKRSALLAGGSDVYGLATGTSDIPWEGFYPSDTQDATALEGIAGVQLTARDDAGDTVRLRIKLASDPTNGRYLPFEHILLDDRVTVHTGTGQWDWNEDTFPVAAITLSLRQGGDWDCWVDLGSSYTSMADRAFQARGVPTHSHPPNPALCTTTLATGETATLYEEWTWDPSNPTVTHPGSASTGPSGGNVWGSGSTSSAVVTPGTGAESSTKWSNFSHDGGSNSVAATAGTTYRFTGYFNATQYNFDGRILVKWLNSSDAVIQTDQLAYSAAWPRAWTLWSADVTAPVGATQFYLIMYVGTTGTVGISGSIDQVRVYTLSAGSDSTGLDELTGTSNQAARCDHNHLHNDLLGRDAADTHAASSISYDGEFSGSTATNVQDRLDEFETTASGHITTTLGGGEAVDTHGLMGTTETIDLADGNIHSGTLDDDVTLTFTGYSTAGDGISFALFLTQDGTGGHSVTFPAEVVNATDLTAALDTTADTLQIVSFVSADGGTNVYGFIAGGGGASGVADDLTTAETDTSLRLAPDGAGGVEWAAGASADAWIVDPGAPSYSGTGPVTVALTSKFGIDGSGNPYYNAANVTDGEEAALVWDSETETYFLRPYYP